MPAGPSSRREGSPTRVVDKKAAARFLLAALNRKPDQEQTDEYMESRQQMLEGLRLYNKRLKADGKQPGRSVASFSTAANEPAVTMQSAASLQRGGKKGRRQMCMPTIPRQKQALHPIGAQYHGFLMFELFGAPPLTMHHFQGITFSRL